MYQWLPSLTGFIKFSFLYLPLVCAVNAANIPVINPGFEADPTNIPPLSDGDYCNINCGDFPGWGITTNSWIADPLASQVVLPSGYGDQLLAAYFNAGGLQNLDSFYEETNYRLTVDIGDRLDTGFSGGHIALAFLRWAAPGRELYSTMYDWNPRRLLIQFLCRPGSSLGQVRYFYLSNSRSGTGNKIAKECATSDPRSTDYQSGAPQSN